MPDDDPAQDGNGSGLGDAENDANQNLGNEPAGGAVQSCGSSAPPPVVVDPDKSHWIEIELLEEDGTPVPGEEYRVKLPDGSPVEGYLDDDGFAGIYGIDPGSCKVTFPNLDENIWHPK